MQETRWAILPKPRGKHCGEQPGFPGGGGLAGSRGRAPPTLPRDQPCVGLGLLAGPLKASKTKESWFVGGPWKSCSFAGLGAKCGELSREKEPSLQSSKEGPRSLFLF